MLPSLSVDERLRYDRQIGYGVLSEEGQRRLKAATALVTRVGGLGGPAALALAMAGVGKIIIAHGGDLEIARPEPAAPRLRGRAGKAPGGAIRRAPAR